MPRRFVLPLLLIPCIVLGCGPTGADENQSSAADIYQPRLYPVVENGRWGFIDSQGEVVVTPRYEWAANFSRDLALVRENGLYGDIWRNGVVAIEQQCGDAWDFVDGLDPVSIAGHWRYIDAEGVRRVEPQFELNPPVLEEREDEYTDL